MESKTEAVDPGFAMTPYLIVIECCRGVVGHTTIYGTDPVDAREQFENLLCAGGPFEAGLTFDGLRDNCTEEEVEHYHDAMVEGFRIVSCVDANRFPETRRTIEIMQAFDTITIDLAS